MPFQRIFWIAIIALVFADYAWASALSLVIRLNYNFLLSFCGAFGLSLILTRLDRLPRVALLSLTIAQFIVMLSATIVLSYLAAAMCFPLIDRQLAAVDRLLGMDWLATYHWVKANPRIDRILDLAYGSLPVQLPLVVVMLSVMRRDGRLHEFISMFGISLCIIIVISLFFPAAGAWDFFGLTDLANDYYLRDFYAVRDGTMRVIDLNHLNGIVQFPSFHAALGLIFILSTRGIYVVAPLSVCLNTLMIFSAVTNGGHHLADALAGPVVVLAVWRCLKFQRYDLGNAAVGTVYVVSDA